MKGHYGSESTSELDRILNEVYLHNGISLNRDGHSPTHGYMVSVKNMYIRQGIALSQAELNKLKEAIADNPYRYIGGWFEEKTGRTHWDISALIPTKELAIAEARAFNELAIYDAANAQEITL